MESVPRRYDVQLIVIDDGSTDNTWLNILDWYASNIEKSEEPANILLSHSAENKGVGATVNTGYDLASGEYVVLLGSDDYFYSDVFIDILKELDGTDLVYFNLQINNGSIWYLSENTKREYCGSTKFMRREFIGDTRNPEIRATEDWYFYQELLKKNPTEKFTHRVLKHYNFPREGSLTWNAHKGVK